MRWRAFYREALTTTAGIVLVLVIVLVLFGVTAALGQAVRGDYAESIVFRLIGWQTLLRLDLLLPLGLYLGVLLTFSRWYRDSEMAVLAACGISLGQLWRPVVVLSAVVALLTAAAAFYLKPYADRSIEALKAEGGQRSDIVGIVPGKFTESGPDRIIYAQDITANGGLSQVFVSSPIRGAPRVVLARLGRSVTDPRTGDRFVALSNGWAYEGTPGEPDYRMARFDSYLVRVVTPAAATPSGSIDTLPTAELWRSNDPRANAELQWRLSRPISVFILATFALVLAYTDARRGRLANLFIAILVYFIYSNLLGVGQTFLKQAKLPSEVGLWWVHGLMAAIAVVLFYRRSRNLPLLPLRRFKPA